MRVLFSSTPGLGHIQPMVPLARALEEGGHEVRWATAPDGCDWLARAGIEVVPAGLTVRQRQEEYARRWPEAASLVGQERVAHMFPHLFGAVSAVASFDALLAAARDFRPDVLVSEAGDFAAPVVASAVGIPQVTHAFGLVVPSERVAAAAEFAQELWGRVGLEPRRYGGCYDTMYLDIYPPSLQPDDLSHVGRIERRRPESHTAIEGEGLPEDVAALLDDGRPALYVTFGSVFNDNPAFRSVVQAVATIPGVVAVVTVGPDGDVGQFGHLPAHVEVKTYIAQSLLLDRCSAVVSHAGSGTLLAAMAHGLPQVCVPQAADQLRNAAACASAGAGIALFGDEAKSDAVAAAIGAVLADDSYRFGARRLADEIAAMPPVEAAAAAIESLCA